MKRLILTASALLAAVTLSEFSALGQASSEDEILAIETITGHSETLSEIARSVTDAMNREDLKKATGELSRQDLCFDSYFSAHLGDFADSAPVMETVAKYKESRAAIDEEIAEKTAYMDAREAIDKANECLTQAKADYEKLLKQAKKFSQVQQTAKLLAKVKAKEQLEFTKIQTGYTAAAAAAEPVSELEDDLAALEEKFTDISITSGMIQEMEYKPLVQRVKDYLMSFAAIAILLMFVNMVQARISAAKKTRESLKKMQETINGNEQDIPTI